MNAVGCTWGDFPRYDLSIKMPKLAVDGRTTKLREIHNGDAQRQFEALWQYIQSLPETGTRE